VRLLSTKYCLAVCWVLVLLLRASKRRFDADATPSVEVVSYYWHFVDVVWIGLWATLFVLR